MVRKREYHRRNNSQGGFSVQGQRNLNEQAPGRENTQIRSFNKDNSMKQNYSNHSSPPRCGRAKEDETVEDIREDIARIEKEIKLELKEIRSLKLGL